MSLLAILTIVVVATFCILLIIQQIAQYFDRVDGCIPGLCSFSVSIHSDPAKLKKTMYYSAERSLRAVECMSSAKKGGDIDFTLLRRQLEVIFEQNVDDKN